MSTTGNSNTERIELLIDSSARSTGVAENFTINLANKVGKVLYGEVIGAEIPFTYYTVNSTNNVLAWNSGADYACTVTPGTYAISDFITELQNDMNAQQNGYTINYNQSTFKLTFNNAAPFTLQQSNTAGTTTIQRVIGMDLINPTATGTAVTPPNVINLSGTKYILIKCPELVRPKIIRPILNASGYDNTLYKVPVNGTPGQFLVEKNTYSNPLHYGVRQVITTLTLQLYDDLGNIMDLNGSNWSITINLFTG